MAQPAVEPAADEESSWVDGLAAVIERWVPDALTTAILLMVILIVMSLAVGGTVTQTMDAYYRGLWQFLGLTMQVTLIFVLSFIMSTSPIFRKVIVACAKVPTTRAGVVIGATLVAAVISYLNWGLALALGPLISMHYCREAERKGIQVDFLFMLAVIAGAGSIWQFGLSATAPLIMATPTNALVQQLGEMSLASTIWSPAAIIHVVTFLTASVVVGIVFMPKRIRQISYYPEALRVADAEPEVSEPGKPGASLTPAQWLERSPLVLVPVILMLVGWLYYHFFVQKLSLELNSTITALLLICMLVHPNVMRFQSALQEAVTLAWPIVVLYHLYAGVAGLIQFTPVGEFIASTIAPISTRYTFPFLIAAISTVIAIFIPTSGGQWAIQGAVTVSAAEAAGVSAQRGLLALSVGDHMGNLLTPFWAVVGAGVARVDFRLFFGYRLIFAILWFVVGTICFTFLPC